MSLCFVFKFDFKRFVCHQPCSCPLLHNKITSMTSPTDENKFHCHQKGHDVINVSIATCN